MNWIDLATAPPSDVLQADICIIGAGAAGIYLALQLASQGKSVVLIEAGPTSAVNARSVGFMPSFVGDEYAGAITGRYFGLGGTTSRWGGNLVPHTSYDVRDDVYSSVWGRIASCVKEQSPAVLARFGYTKDAMFEQYAIEKLGSVADVLAKAGLDVQASLMLPFSQKNLLNLLHQTSRSNCQPRIFYNAVAKDWILSNDGKRDNSVRNLLAVSRNGNKLSVNADKYILAAGAIESARILLEIDQSTFQQVLPKDSSPGCFLADHLSLTIADVALVDLKKASRLFGPHFEGNWMRGMRFLKKEINSNSPRAFAHFEFQNESAGFVIAREVLQAVQGHSFPAITVKSLIAGVGDLARLGYYRYIKSRLYIPENTPVNLQLDIEQYPRIENNISLSDENDEYGRRKAVIKWKISSADLGGIECVTNQFLSLWPGKKAGLPDLIPRELNADSRKPYDAYHPVGTCRMGENKEAVVDFNLKVHGLGNMWVVSTGVLPSAGTANPTFTMLCLANKLATQLG